MLLLVAFSYGSAYGQLNSLETTAIDYLHSTLSKKLGVNSDQFLLYPGNATIGGGSMWLWNILNSTVTEQDDIYYDPVQYNYLSGNYNNILYHANVSATLSKECNLEYAIEYFQQANNTFAWNKTMDDLMSGLNNSPPLKFSLDTTVPEDIGDTTTKPVMMHLTINASFGHALNFISYPYEPGDSLTPLPPQYHPWYSPCILSLAYTNTNNSFLSAAEWNSIFGPSGSLQRVTYALVVVSGESILLTATDNTTTYSTTVATAAPSLLGVMVATIPAYISSDK